MSDLLIIKKVEGLSKSQITFNKLIKNIALKTKQIQNFEKNIKFYQVQLANELGASIKNFLAAKLKLAQSFDHMYENNKFSQKESEKLVRIIINICTPDDPTIVETGTSEELEKIHDKYGQIELSKLSDYENEMVKESIFGMLRHELGLDIEFGIEEELDLKKIKEKIKAATEQQNEYFKDQENLKRKNKHIGGKSAKSQALAEQLNKSWKTIYLNLVKKLHPDTQQDEQKKEEFENVLKEVTIAYETSNFYKLLEFDLKYSESNGFDQKNEIILAEYIRILKKQDAEMKNQIMDLEGFLFEKGLYFLRADNAEKATQANLLKAGELLKVKTTQLYYDEQTFSNVSALKKYLKSVRMNDLGGELNNLPF